MNGYETKVTPQEQGLDDYSKHHETRCKAVIRTGYLSVVMIVSGVLSMGLGVAIVTLGHDGKNPITSGFSITSGALIFAAGCSSLVFSSMEPTPTDDKRKVKQGRMMMAFYIQAMTAIGPTGIAIGYSIWGAVACGQDKISICGPELDAQLVLNIICIFLAFINFGTIMASAMFFGAYRKAFGIGSGCYGCCQTRC